MKDLVDYIKYHGYITSIRANVNKDYIWFDICQKEFYKDKNGEDKYNLSFFSARMYIEYSNKIELKLEKMFMLKVYQKGYVDKKGHRQNYIHVLKINEIVVNKEPPLYGDGYWNGQKIPTGGEPLTEEDIKIQKKLEEIINSFR